MKIFLDTANLENIIKWYKTGIIDGVTTNPTHLSKECGELASKEGGEQAKLETKKLTPTELVKAICEVVESGVVSVEVTETEPEKVYAQAKKIAKIAKNVVVKIPCHENYYEVIKRLAQEGVPLNITLIFTMLQGLMMSKLGVQYISPFIGRLNDAGENGIKLVEDLSAITIGCGFFDTKIIAASIRDVKTFEAVALAGADVATVPVAVLEKATQHPLTDTGMKQFLDDWKKLGIKQFP